METLSCNFFHVPGKWKISLTLLGAQHTPRRESFIQGTKSCVKVKIIIFYFPFKANKQYITFYIEWRNIDGKIGSFLPQNMSLSISIMMCVCVLVNFQIVPINLMNKNRLISIQNGSKASFLASSFERRAEISNEMKIITQILNISFWGNFFSITLPSLLLAQQKKKHKKKNVKVHGMKTFSGKRNSHSRRKNSFFHFVFGTKAAISGGAGEGRRREEGVMKCVANKYYLL